jgi:hypothetical protein
VLENFSRILFAELGPNFFPPQGLLKMAEIPVASEEVARYYEYDFSKKV